MRRTRLLPFVFLVCFTAMPAAAQHSAAEAELRAELAKMRDQVARVEALLARMERERGAAEAASSPQNQVAAPQDNLLPAAQALAAARRTPALNTPPMLPVSSSESFRKNPPRFDVLLMARGDFLADTARNDTFFLRKAELGVKGHISEHVDFSLEIDPVRTNDPLRRTYVRLTHFERLHMKFGLEKAPIGLEELTATGQIPFVDRSEITDRFAAAEELGAHFESRWNKALFQFAVTNGGRRLLRDDNSKKDVSGRIVFAPHRFVSFGAAALSGEIGPMRLPRDRYNGELRIGNNMTGFQSEFFRARDAAVWSSAFYTAAYWAIPLRTEWFSHIQPVARYEFIGRSDRDALNELRLFTFGFSLMLSEHRSKFQLNYLRDLHTGARRDELRGQYLIEF